jgi:hypothetical protein
MVRISKTEVGDSLDLLGPVGALGFCQPDGTFVTTLDDRRELLAEMATSGEAVCVDGLATRVQPPAGWATRRCRATPSGMPHRPGVTVSTVHGDCRDGTGLAGSCYEQELLALSGLDRVWTSPRPPAC